MLSRVKAGEHLSKLARLVKAQKRKDVVEHLKRFVKTQHTMRRLMNGSISNALLQQQQQAQVSGKAGTNATYGGNIKGKGGWHLLSNSEIKRRGLDKTAWQSPERYLWPGLGVGCGVWGGDGMVVLGFPTRESQGNK